MIMPPLIDQVLQDQEFDSVILGMTQADHQSDETNGLTTNVSDSKRLQPQFQRRKLVSLNSRTHRWCALMLISSIISLIVAVGISTYQWKEIEKLRKDLDSK